MAAKEKTHDKAGVFLEKAVHREVKILAMDEGVSVSKFIEALVLRRLKQKKTAA